MLQAFSQIVLHFIKIKRQICTASWVSRDITRKRCLKGEKKSLKGNNLTYSDGHLFQV